jgi:hypothetical protein
VAGIAGVGKSKWAAGMVPDEEQSRTNGNKWCDGYCPELQTAVIVEDMVRVNEYMAGGLLSDNNEQLPFPRYKAA